MAPGRFEKTTGILDMLDDVARHDDVEDPSEIKVLSVADLDVKSAFIQ